MKDVIKLNVKAFLWAVVIVILSYLQGYMGGYAFIGIFGILLFVFVVSRFVSFSFPFKKWSGRKFAYIYILAIIYGLTLHFGMLSWTYGSARCGMAKILGQSFSSECDSNGCTCTVY